MSKATTQYAQIQNRQLVRRRRYQRAALNVLNKITTGVESRVRAGARLGAVPGVKSVANQLKQYLAQPAADIWNEAALHAMQEIANQSGGSLPNLKFLQDLPHEVEKSGVLPGHQYDETDAVSHPFSLEKKVTPQDIQNLGMGTTRRKVYDAGNFAQIKTVSESLIGRIRTEIDAGLKAKQGTPQLVKRIQTVTGHNEWRARRISQTETTRLWAQSSQNAYEKSNVVKKKKWLINTYGNVRGAHRTANNQERPVNEAFLVGGQSLMYPGDAIGSPENVINCACAMMPVVGVPVPLAGTPGEGGGGGGMASIGTGGKPKKPVAVLKPKKPVSAVKPKPKPEAPKTGYEGKAWLDAMTDDEKTALNTWQGRGYVNIKAMQRSGKSYEGGSVKQVKENIRLMENALKKDGEYEGVVYRGLNNVDEFIYKELISADEITWDTFTSTTKSLDTAIEFASDFGGGDLEGSIIFKIKAKRGVDLEEVTKWGNKTNEDEVLMSMGQRYKVVKVTENKEHVFDPGGMQETAMDLTEIVLEEI